MHAGWQTRAHLLSAGWRHGRDEQRQGGKPGVQILEERRGTNGLASRHRMTPDRTNGDTGRNRSEAFADPLAVRRFAARAPAQPKPHQRPGQHQQTAIDERPHGAQSAVAVVPGQAR